MFEFDPMEIGNPMTLGMIEETYGEEYVDGSRSWFNDGYDEYEYDEDDSDTYSYGY